MTLSNKRQITLICVCRSAFFLFFSPFYYSWTSSLKFIYLTPIAFAEASFSSLKPGPYRKKHTIPISYQCLTQPVAKKARILFLPWATCSQVKSVEL